MDPTAARLILMYFILPLWLAAGFADYLCYRAAHEWAEGVASSSSANCRMAVPVLAANFLEINALIILIMIVSLVLHQANSIWDVRYAMRRAPWPRSSSTCSVLEMLPLMALLIIATLHWG